MASGRYDLERLLADLQMIVETYLNDQLDAISSEKADGIALDHVATSAYAFQEMNSKIMNYNPFVFYGIDNIQTIQEGPAHAQSCDITFLLLRTDGGEDTSIMTKMLRYGRALREIFRDHWTWPDSQVKIAMKSLEPVNLKLINSDDPYRAVGVMISVVLY